MAAVASPAQRIRNAAPASSAEGDYSTATSTAVSFQGFATASRYGHPYFDFKAAPSLFLDEDLRQEDFSLAHRSVVRDGLANAEVAEAAAVAARRDAEANAQMLSAQERNAACYAAETREVERAAVAQRAELQHKYEDAEQAAMAARARADELRAMLASAAQEQARAQAEHASAAAASEKAATCAREGEFCAVQCRLANDNCYTERSALEGQGHRGPLMSSLLGARGGYIQDGSVSMQVRARCGMRTRGHP
jgi:hypothetical protein